MEGLGSSLAAKTAGQGASPSYEAVALQSDDRKIVRSIEKDPWNRLHSIVEDSRWVSDVAHHIPHLPLIPNLRCGAWYAPRHLLPPESQASTYCYFKSTDGHANEWSFSLKRPNLGVLQLIQERGGVIIVDSTRRGKSLPDALSKTIPIWCAVLTEASRRLHGQPSVPPACDMTGTGPFRATKHGHTALRTPSHQVPPSEHAQMEDRMHKWVTALMSSDLPIPKLDKPIVPFFLTRPWEGEDRAELLDRLSRTPPPKDVYPVILLSASRRVDLPTPSPSGQYYYTQGSGDDEELWSHGLTPDMFWSESHHRRLMSTPYSSFLAALTEVIRSRTPTSENQPGADPRDETATASQYASDTEIGSTGLFVGKRLPWHTFTQQEREQYGLIVHCDAQMPERTQDGGSGESSEKNGPPPQSLDRLEQEFEGLRVDQASQAVVLYLGIAPGKKGLAAFRSHLPAVLSAAEKTLLPARADRPASSIRPDRILFVDSTLKDLALSFCVAILARFFSSPQGPAVPSTALSKEEIRKRLQWVAQSLPQANPSRNHMLRINEVLLSPVATKIPSDSEDMCAQ